MKFTNKGNRFGMEKELSGTKEGEEKGGGNLKMESQKRVSCQRVKGAEADEADEAEQKERNKGREREKEKKERKER